MVMVAVAGGDTSLCSGAPWPGQQQPAPSGQPCRHPATGPGPTWATELQSCRAQVSPDKWRPLSRDLSDFMLAPDPRGEKSSPLETGRSGG